MSTSFDHDQVAGSAAFGDDATRAMAIAYEEICTALRLSVHSLHERQQIAMRVLDLARTGVLDAETLRDRVLAEGRHAI